MVHLKGFILLMKLYKDMFFFRFTAGDLPDSNLLDVRDKFADPRFGFRGSIDGLFGLCVLLCVRTGADGTRARSRGSAVQKQEVSES